MKGMPVLSYIKILPQMSTATNVDCPKCGLNGLLSKRDISKDQAICVHI